MTLLGLLIVAAPLLATLIELTVTERMTRDD